MSGALNEVFNNIFISDCGEYWGWGSFQGAVIKAMGKIHTNKEVWIYVSSIKIKNVEIALIMPVMQS